MPYLMLSDASAFAAFMNKVFDAELSFSKQREDSEAIMHS
jgi:uncharacterized glyoxalase superfamily protein PhnB